MPCRNGVNIEVAFWTSIAGNNGLTIRSFEADLTRDDLNPVRKYLGNTCCLSIAMLKKVDVRKRPLAGIITYSKTMIVG